MDIQHLDQSIVQFYKEISTSPSFQRVNYFSNAGTIGLNQTSFDNIELYQRIAQIINNLKELGIDHLLQYRMHIYHQKVIETIPILKSLDLNLDLIEKIGSITSIQRSVIHLIDLAIYQIAIEDQTHEALNILRETLFTLEDYCLQIEHTINLRKECQATEIDDDLQVKLSEDEKQMQTYYKQLKSITDLVIKNLKRHQKAH